MRDLLGLLATGLLMTALGCGGEPSEFDGETDETGAEGEGTDGATDDVSTEDTDGSDSSSQGSDPSTQDTSEGTGSKGDTNDTSDTLDTADTLGTADTLDTADTATQDTEPENQPPVPVIEEPVDEAYFKTDASIEFVGSASDPEDGVLEGTALRWLNGADQIGLGRTVQTALLLGDHVITLEATDSAGGVGTTSITVHVVDNLPPECVIHDPDEGDRFFQGESIRFRATCTDPEGEPVQNIDISWASDVQGNIGIGADVTNALVDLGEHRITVCAKDPVEPKVVGCADVTITITENQPPEVQINSPDSGAELPGCEEARLRCRAIDPEDRGGVEVVWMSDVDGEIGTNDNLNWLPGTSGTHTLRCTATDSDGKSAYAEVTVTFISPGPVIGDPNDGDVFNPGDDITFLGRACDTEDGELTGAALVWSSDVDGEMGTGTSVQTNGLSPGTHVITLTATDADGNSESTSITIYVSFPPNVKIEAPTDGSHHAAGGTVDFVGTAEDPEDGPLTPTWWDSVRGEFHSGTETSESGLLPGKYEVRLTAADSTGRSASDEIAMYVVGDDPLFEQTGIDANVAAAAWDADSGIYWIATDNGLFGYDPVTGDATSYGTWNSDLPDSNIRDVIVLADGTLMVATNEGLAVGCEPADLSNCENYYEEEFGFELGSATYQAVVQLPDGRTIVGLDECLVFSNWQTEEHRLFCGGDGGGDGLIDSDIRDLVYDETTGDVWIATQGGVSRMTPADAPEVMERGASTFKDYTEDDGLASNNVRSIAIAGSGDVWFATAGGVTRLETKGGVETFTSFNISDGLPASDTRDLAIDVITVGAEDKEIVWAATTGGLGRIDAAIPSVIGITTADGLLDNDCRSVFVQTATHAKFVGTGAGLDIYRGM